MDRPPRGSGPALPWSALGSAPPAGELPCWPKVDATHGSASPETSEKETSPALGP